MKDAATFDEKASIWLYQSPAHADPPSGFYAVRLHISPLFSV